MKKVMICILILIPVLIVLIVAMVSSIVSLQAWIAVDDIELTYKGGKVEAETLTYSFDEVANKTLNIYDYVDVKVYPEKAKNYTIEWRVTGTISYTDSKYQQDYNNYKSDLAKLRGELENEFSQNGSFEDEDRQSAYEAVKSRYPDSSKMLDAMAKILIPEVKPALAFVDKDGNVVQSNTTGDFIICSYCHGTIEVVVENVSKTILISVGGDNVKSVTISNLQGDESNTLNVGESKRITASYTPIDSIVNHTIWNALDEDIATIDQNGVITAKKAGTARFTMQASVHSTDGTENVQYVTSNVYTLEVKAEGASSVFGSKVVSHKRSYSLAELGIADDYDSIEGATVVDNILTVNEGVSRVVVNTKRGKFTLNVCEDNDIAIRNADFYCAENGYVLAVGENTLKLGAVWASAFKSGNPSVVWASDNEDVASVSQNGEVLAKKDGNVTITVTSEEGTSASIILNVRNKISYLQLRTSNEALAVGLARETVFASFRYVNEDISQGDATETNWTYITILGEPKRTSDMTADEYSELLASFYDAYDIKIVSGGEYAHLDDVVKNKLIFNPEALEGKGKQPIRVRVSAKYPKYEGMTKFTTAEVTINAIYGVSVYNVAQIEHAAMYQREYVEFGEFDALMNAVNSGQTYETKTGNLQPSVQTFYHVDEITGDKYIVKLDGSSLRTYAIVMMANCDYTQSGRDKIGGPNERLNFFGDVYGNNKMITANASQFDIYDELVRVSWSGVTISNVILRGNQIEGDGNIDPEDTKGFMGRVAIVGSHHGWNLYRLTDVTFEYCIIENSKQGVTTRNSDVTYNGCVMRNFLQCGMYVPIQMNWEDSDNAYHPYYSHITLNNFTCSNTLGSVMSAAYERYTITEQKKNRFVPSGTREENGAYFMEHFASKGINLEVTQTGFFKAYNWQNVNNANLIDTGNDTTNKLIGSLAGGIISQNPTFAGYRYIDSNNECYYHMAFLVSGVSFFGNNDMIMDEPTFAKMSFASSEIGGVRLGDIDANGDDGGGIIGGLLSTMYIYGYKNTAEITPFSKLVIDADFIQKLH